AAEVPVVLDEARPSALGADTHGDLVQRHEGEFSPDPAAAQTGLGLGMRSPEVDFDVFDATTLEGSNRNWRELRNRCPVAWTEHNGGHWVITRYEEVAEAFRSWEQFSSARTDPE